MNKRENERLREVEGCKICRDACTVVLCGHLCTCAKCSPSVKKCPTCRRGIPKKRKAFRL